MSVDIPFKKPPIEPLNCELLDRFGVSINVLRLDKIHPSVQGNKWYKLKHNLDLFQQDKQRPILSFGGAYSNHLLALAAAGKQLGMQTIGIVRGELSDPLNPVLAFAQQQGMILRPISRSEYRHKHEDGFLDALRKEWGEFHLLPEGGSNLLAIKGCGEIVEGFRWSSSKNRRLVALCCGTGTTMAGIITALSSQGLLPTPKVLGVSVLKAKGYLHKEVERWLHGCSCEKAIDWSIAESYHCGGYARTNSALLSFLEEFKRWSSIPVEPVYTGKLFFALFDMIKQGQIDPKTEILAIHTGGVN